VLPELHFGLAQDITSDLSGTEQWVLFGFVAVGLGVMLNALQTPLYQVLEGYPWPGPLWDWGRRRQHARYRRLKQRRTALETERKTLAKSRTESADGELPPSGIDLRIGRVITQLDRYPQHSTQFLPTRLGNAIRAFEAYGFDRFHLDVIVLWNELYNSVSESVRTEVDRGRAPSDFFVCLTYLLPVAGLTSLAAGVFGSSGQGALLVGGAVLLVLAPIAYRMAVTSTQSWRSAVQAMVNLGRAPLAAGLGLELPRDVEEERRMWLAVRRVVMDGWEGHTFTELSAELAGFAAPRDQLSAAQPGVSVPGPGLVRPLPRQREADGP
jgi:hypothetical protein